MAYLLTYNYNTYNMTRAKDIKKCINRVAKTERLEDLPAANIQTTCLSDPSRSDVSIVCFFKSAQYKRRLAKSIVRSMGQMTFD